MKKVICDCCSLECESSGTYFRNTAFPVHVVEKNDSYIMLSSSGQFVAATGRGITFDLCAACSDEYHKKSFAVFEEMQESKRHT